MKKGSIRVKHEFEYDPDGVFKMCLACGKSNPVGDYCEPYRYIKPEHEVL